MNKARKRKGKLAADEVQTMTQGVASHSIRVAYNMTLLLALYTLRKSFGFGNKRLHKFKFYLDQAIIDYSKGNVTIKEMAEELKKQDVEVKL